MNQTSSGCVLCALVLLGTVGTLCPAAEPAEPAVPAFPGAEGFGAVASGGRGGRVMRVTHLNEKGPGSLQAACEAAGPRTVVFDVAGVIRAPSAGKGRRRIYIRHGEITIAGQTAPPPGITIEGAVRTLGKGVDNVILRFLRMRPDCYALGLRARGGANADCIGINFCQRAIVDHCSFSWANDECVDLINATDVTLQWCTVEESDIQWEGGDEPHNFAVIVGYTGGRYSLHHNLLAHHHSRAPAFTSLKRELDVRNNVLYNFGTATSTGFGNLVGNYCKSGPGAIWGFPRIYHPPATITLPDAIPYKRGRTFMRGNFLDWRTGYEDAPPRPKVPLAEKPIPVAAVQTHVAEEACDLVLAQAGCLPRDAISGRTIHEIRTGTGAWGRHEPPGDWRTAPAAGKPALDTDADGMPDAWESAHRLDPKDPKDGARLVPAGASAGDRHRGYTFLEYYLNELADRRIAAALTAARLPAPKAAPPAPPDAEPLAKPMDQLVADITSQGSDRKQTDTFAAFYAIQHLSRIGPKAAEAVPALVKALATDDRRKAVFVAWALGAAGPHAKAAVPALIGVLKKGWVVENTKWKFNPRGFAAWALGRIGAEAAAAVPALAEVLHGEDLWARRPAAWALARIGPAARPATDALIRALAYETAGSWSAIHNAQCHAAEALAHIGAAAVPALRRALASGKAAARRGAAMALGQIGPAAKAATADLVKLLGDKDARVRVAAARALARVAPADATAVAALAKSLAGEGNFAVRHQIVGALGDCGPGAGVATDALGRAAKDERREVRRAAFEALGRMGAKAKAVLSAALDAGNDVGSRRHAARALAGAGEAGTAALLGALKDADAGVRREAVWSLTRIGSATRPVLDALRRCRDDRDYVVRFAADRALETLGNPRRTRSAQDGAAP